MKQGENKMRQEDTEDMLQGQEKAGEFSQEASMSPKPGEKSQF